MEESGSRRERPAAWPAPKLAWLLVAAGWLGVALVRWHLRDVPLERDEGEYAYFGQLLLAGLPPFRMAYTLKLPGTEAAYALAMALFGQTAAGVRAGLVLVNAATTALLLLLGRRFLSTAGAVAAALVFAWLSASSTLLGLFGHATHFVVLPAVGGLLVLVSSMETGRLRGILGAGVVLGTAAVMKQAGAVFVIFAAAWLAWTRLRAGTGWRRLLAEEAALLAGAATPLALVVAWVLAGGTFEAFWFWVVRYAPEYSASIPPSEGAGYLAEVASAAFREAPLLWVLAAGGLLLAAWPRWPLPGRSFLLGFAAFAFVGVSAGFYYRPHYFLLLVPAAALLAGTAVDFAVHHVAEGRKRWAAAVGLGAVAIGCVQAVVEQRRLLFESTPAEVSRAIYGANPFPESPEIARYIAARTGPDERIAVLGSEPQILFYARRRGATGHVYAYGLMELHPFARAMQEQMAREIEAARPAYLVYVQVPTSWLVQPESDQWILSWAREYATREFVLVGQVQIVSPDRTEYYWDDLVSRAPERPVNRVLVFRRRDFVPLQGAARRAG